MTDIVLIGTPATWAYMYSQLDFTESKRAHAHIKRESINRAYCGQPWSRMDETDDLTNTAALKLPWLCGNCKKHYCAVMGIRQ
jgi:hypothetical protein